MNQTQPAKTPAKQGDKKTKKEDDNERLSSPTSVSMQNSFIIKNADESFDVYYQSMKKRKHMTGGGELGQGEHKFGLVPGVRPTARDGHSANIGTHGYMYIFGGDRHHMPFNDLYMIQLK